MTALALRRLMKYDPLSDTSGEDSSVVHTR